MKLLAACLLLITVIFAQASPDEGVDKCLKGCCATAQWDDEAKSCHTNGTGNDEDLGKCQLSCVSGASPSLCCAPGAILLVLMALKGGAFAKKQ